MIGPLLAAILFAATAPARPTVLVNGEQIPAAQLAKLLAAEDPDFANRSAAEQRSAIERAVHYELCRRQARAMLRRAGIEPSPEMAAAELAAWDKTLPAGLRINLHRPLTRDPDFELAVGMLRYYRQTAPQRIQPSPEMIETRYRENQPRLKLPPRPELDLLYGSRSDPSVRAKLENARLRALQGADFRQLSKTLNPSVPPACTPAQIAEAALRLPEGVPGPVTPIGGDWVVIRVSKHHPARFLSLEEMTPYLRAVWEYTLAVRELGNDLKKIQQTIKVEVFVP